VNGDWSRNAGATGVGAVLGSKNIKAIAVRGSGTCPATIWRSDAGIENAYAYMADHKLFKMWPARGLMNVNGLRQLME